jgi:putative N6-adenine-specific DNA methylase
LNTTKFEIVAKTFYGLEDVLEEELYQLGVDNIQKKRRAVVFEGDQSMLYKSNLCLRTALRILKPVLKNKLKSDTDLYDIIKNHNWSDHMNVNDTFVIDSIVMSGFFNHSKFVSQKVKDAIADQFREKYGKRPSVDLKNPRIRINVHLMEDKLTVSLDSSGESLHKRGYRERNSMAPLNEVLAAGMIKISGWHGNTNFIDPMCGSGTLPIEAALIALNIPPGLFRKHFGFMGWKDFDEELFLHIRSSVETKTKPDCKIIASDISEKMIELAQKNAIKACVRNSISFSSFSFEKKIPPKESSTVIINPPYGERLQHSDLISFYRTIGDILKKKYMDCNIWIISSNKKAMKFIGLKPVKKMKLYNGSLECEFYNYDIYKGTKKVNK